MFQKYLYFHTDHLCDLSDDLLFKIVFIVFLLIYFCVYVHICVGHMCVKMSVGGPRTTFRSQFSLKSSDLVEDAFVH